MAEADSNQGRIATRKVGTARTKPFDAFDLLAFLIPCLRFIKVQVVGVLSGSDILLLLVFLYLVFSQKLKISANAGKRLLILCSLWFASQCLTDYVRHSVFKDYVRGWSNIGLTFVNLVVFWVLLYGNRKRLALYGWGLVCGTLLTVLVSPDEYMKDDPWKFGLAFTFTWATLLVASSKRCRASWAIGLAVMAAVVNLMMGSRSMCGFCAVTALFLLNARSARRRAAAGKQLNKSVTLAVAASLLLGVAGIFWAYQYAATSGALGEDAKEKYEAQSSGKYGLLLGSRSEMLGYIPAIYDSPILGHGSWAKEPAYMMIERQALTILGYKDAETFSLESFQEGLIPTHSHIFGAWVDAGVLGAIFWIAVFFYTARALFQLHAPQAMLVPLASFAIFSLLWDLLFSPYGAQMRIINPFYIVLALSSVCMVPKKLIRKVVAKTKRRVVVGARVVRKVNTGNIAQSLDTA